MERSNVLYMTPDEVRNLDKSQIASMTMTSGSIIFVNHENQFIEENMIDQNSYQMYPNLTDNNFILRAKKGEDGEEGEVKDEGKVEVQMEEQPEVEEGKAKEILRGPDGKPLLNDILTGGDFLDQGQQEQPPTIEENTNQQDNIPQQEPYYEPPGEQVVPEQNAEMNNDGYNEQFYPPEEQNNINYDPNSYPQEQQPLYPPQEINNQDVPEQNVEPNIENENYPQEEPNMYPELGDNTNNQNYQPPMNVPQEQQEYYPEEQPQQQDYQQPMNVPQEEQGYYPDVQPSDQQQPLEPPVEPLDQPPLQEPIQPPTQIPIQPQPQPSDKQPIQPSVQPNTPNQQIPGANKGKYILPQQAKMPKVQIKLGFNMPIIPKGGMGRRFPIPPHRPIGVMGPHGPIGVMGPMGPHGPMRRPVPQPHGMVLFPPGRKIPGGAKGKIIINNPIGKVINLVNEVMSPLGGVRVKRMGLRSTKPTTAQKEVEQVSAQTDNVLRARRTDVYNYEQQEEVLCPECSYEEYGYKYAQCGNDGVITQGYTDNYNFHEIVETSDNSKSYVVAKKGGVTVSYDS